MKKKEDNSPFCICSLCGFLRGTTNDWAWYEDKIVHLECLEKAMKKKEGVQIECAVCGKKLLASDKSLWGGVADKALCSLTCRDKYETLLRLMDDGVSEQGRLPDYDKTACQTCGKVIEWASQIISFADHNRLFCSAVCRDDFILRSKAAKLFQDEKESLPVLSVEFSESEVSVLVRLLSTFSPNNLMDLGWSNEEIRNILTGYVKIKQVQIDSFNREWSGFARLDEGTSAEEKKDLE